MRFEVFLLLLAMAFVAYLPRAIPVVLIDKMRFGPKFEKFLRLIPYTAMSALIFPGVLFVDGGRYEIGIVGGLVAGALAWKKLPVMVCVLAAVAADMALYLCLP